jgi:photosystem II stability/assembly factor-like uncharacterized protein
VIAVDLDSGEIDLDAPDTTFDAREPDTGLPLVTAAAQQGSTLVAAVARKPPLVVSHDSGATWREAGAGLPEIVSVAIAPDHPDTVVAASTERLYVSHDGGRFWAALPVELDGVTALAWP